MLGFLKRKSREELEAEIAHLNSQVETLEDRVTRAEASEKDAEIRLSRKDTYYKVAMENLRSENEIEVAGLNRQIETLEADFEDSVAVATQKIQVKADKELEESKASYRKHLKTELNSKVEGLEKEVEKLTKSSSTAEGELKGANSTIEILKAQLATSNSLVEKVLGSLPEVSASITTPTFSVPAVQKTEQKK